MPNFVFRVGTPEGSIIERKVHAIDFDSAQEELRREGLHIFGGRRARLSAEQLLPHGRKVVSTEKFLLFNQELLALVRAGLPIVQSFDLMIERQKSTRFRTILSEIRDKIQSGVALSDAFADYGPMFPAMYSTSLRAGERSGDLEGVIRRFLRYQKLIVNLRKRVISAMIYPAVLVSVSCVMIFVMLTYVIPKFAEFYAGFDAELPAFTQLMIAVSHFIRSNIVLAAIVIAGVVFLTKQWSRTATGGAALDRWKLKVPLAGGVLHRFGIMQFTQALGTLLGGGTPMVPAIEISSASVTNRFISGRIGGIAQRVREGEPLWRSLDETRVMSDLAVEMVKVGESTGALTEMLSNVSEFYDEEIEASLSRMIALIEPVILVVLGVVIAGLLYAFYLPLFQLVRAGQ